LSGRLDVLIRGAGPVGCTLALALRGSGLRIAVVDSSSFRDPGFRPIALSYASRLILERIGAWDGLAATPIEAIEVSHAGGFGRTHLGAADAGVPALGYVTDYSSLLEILRSRLHGLVSREEGEAACVVHAEGSSAKPPDKRYAQDALVGLVRTEPPSGSMAFERFTPEGPLALLPLAGRYALVWCLRPERAERLSAAPQAAVLEELSAAIGGRAGRPLTIEALGMQPLGLRVRAARIAQRSVYIGNAAQTLHPVAGQGLNLGLRDAWELAQVLRGAADPGDAATLERYAARRRLDAAATVRVTDWLAGGFLGSGRAARAARGAALTALDLLPGPRRFFARRMIFGPFALP